MLDKLTRKIGLGPQFLLKDRDDLGAYKGDTMYEGNPDAVMRARDLKDVEEMLVFCSKEKIPVTFCGSQTSMTGSSAADEGLLISCEKMDRLITIDQVSDHEAYAICQPGIVVGDLKRAVLEEGWFFPPAPTSQDMARLGATIATNATGEDSYKYGSTRPYVSELKVMLADGTKKVFFRHPDNRLSDELNRAGYWLKTANPIDQIIGSEGTLGLVTETRVRLIKNPGDFFSLMIPFSSEMAALQFILAVTFDQKLKPRALEYIDATALSFMQTHASFPETLKGSQALVYLKQEFLNQADYNQQLEACLQWLSLYISEKQIQDIAVGDTFLKKEAMRLWRHQIPLKINEEYRTYWQQGGGKIGSDWWVPLNHLLEMMTFVYETGRQSKIPFLAFAHLGQGHPHVNYLCKTPEEKLKAEQLLLDCCRKAVSLGGGVAGEHGIGKIHRDYMPLQWSAAVLQKMKSIKTEYDPHWLLGRGNIFKT